MRFSAAGDMLLDGGSFDVRDGGTIEGAAGGDLTAIGKFRAELGGCVGLAAGGTLDTSSAEFDVTPVGSCP